MDYKELTNRLVCAGRIEKYYDEDSSGLYTRASTAITDLLARAEAAEARAEKAERERDAAVKDLEIASDCRTCGNVSPWCIENPDKCKGYKWRGQKED